MRKFHEKVVKLKSQPRWIVRSFILLWAILGGVFAFVSHPIGGTNAQTTECPEWKLLVTGDAWDVCVTNDKDIVIQATATEDNQTLKINKYFANDYTVDRWDGTTGNLTEDTTHTYSASWTYNIILSTTASRRTFTGEYKPLVPSNWTTVTWVKIIYMPSLAEWFGNSETNPGDYFFSYFNSNWSLTSLQSWSFNTNNITTVGDDFFSYFNADWSLTSLPSNSFGLSAWLTTVENSFFASFNAGWSLTSLPSNSFKIENITGVKDSFFASFNADWSLTSLPANSFKLSTSLTTVGNSFFASFNAGWSLTSLPYWSFKMWSITTVGNNFFSNFNSGWSLTSLPSSSFQIYSINTVGDYFFASFNAGWSLISLPKNSFYLSTSLTTVGNNFFSNFNAGWSLTSLATTTSRISFMTENINTVGNDFFAGFNSGWSLTSLPAKSFKLSTSLTTVGNNFFSNFNAGWSLISLPESSFDIRKITTVGNNFFAGFNASWSLTSLPVWSFNTTKITTVCNWFFSNFNAGWSLTNLPLFSFNTSNITTLGNDFFAGFNSGWNLTSLPDSFKLNSLAYDKSNWYINAFNSPNYTLNRNVSDLVSWLTAPNSDRNTFSDNQLWRCGVADNWLVTPASSCNLTVTFNTNSWDAIPSISSYNGGQIVLPKATRRWYAFLWWYTWNENNIMPWWALYTVTANTTFNAKRGELKDIVLQATAIAANQTMEIASYFSNWYTVDRWDDSMIDDGGGIHTYSESWTYTITLSLTWWASRWTFRSDSYPDPLVPRYETTVTWVQIVYMPSLSGWFWDSATNPWNKFFNNFNYEWVIISLPEWSFDTSYITTVGDAFFGSFNYDWLLTSLPANSFNTSNITSVGGVFFANFNREWKITSLPEWSFNTENIISMGSNFFAWFSYKWALTSLPDSFKLNSLAYNIYGGYANAFNSPNYTLNRNVSDLVSWLTAPDSDRNTFSDNQPWRCGVAANWLVSTSDACSITYDYNWWTSAITTKKYSADTTSVVAWSEITTPTRANYVFDWWYTQPTWWTGITTVTFPSMDSGTLYAHWSEIYTITFIDSNWTETGVVWTWNYWAETSWEVSYPNWTRNWYTLSWSGVIPATVPAEDTVITAIWTRKQSSGWWGWGGGGWSSSSKTENKCETCTWECVDWVCVEWTWDTNTWDNHDPIEVVIDKDKFDPDYSDEMNEAYQYAFQNKITTMESIWDAYMQWNLTRIAMAKMLSQYAINVLWKTPDATRYNKFADVTEELDAEYDSWVTLAYQLWFMWINIPDNRFRPFDNVTRAEFVTALSRMRYNTPDWTDVYYSTHMELLKKLWIITNTNPTMLELRWYVMIMLMRAR